MKDRDVVERFRAVMGVGQIYELRTGSRMHRWQTSNRRDTLRAAVLLYPWLGERRRGQVENVVRRMFVAKTNRWDGHMKLEQVAARLRSGERVTFRAFGNSMRPLIPSGSLVTVAPLSEEEKIAKGQIVLARVRSRYYLHHAAAFRPGLVRIDNHHGRSNGWTARKNVVGVLVDG